MRKQLTGALASCDYVHAIIDRYVFQWAWTGKILDKLQTLRQATR